MAMPLDGVHEGADIREERLGDLRFANDIALLAEQAEGLQEGADGSSAEESKNGHETKHTENGMPILGRGK